MDGGCSDRQCAWGLYARANDGGPPPSDNEQMAEHQIEMLAEAGFQITRGSPRVSDD